MLKKLLVAGLIVTPLILAQSAAALSLNDIKAKLNETNAAPAPAASTAAPATASTNTTPTAAPSSNNPLAQFSTKDQVGSLRQALTQAAERPLSKKKTSR